MAQGKSPIYTQEFFTQYKNLLQDNKALVFLTLDENLDFKGDFAFAEPLLWRNLRAYDGFMQIPPFYAVFVLQKSYGYVAFLGDEKLLCLKNLPQFTLDYLQGKDEAQRLSFLDERICEQKDAQKERDLVIHRKHKRVNERDYKNFTHHQQKARKHCAEIKGFLRDGFK